jgi:serine/threonine protein kinase
VHVADFGIARIVDGTGSGTLTAVGTVLGTAGYLAPEQARGDPTTPASDRYALAVVAYELLTGSRPFERTTSTAEAAAHVGAPIPSATERNRRLPPEVDAVFRRALAKDPSKRHETAGELVHDLRAAVDAGEPETAVVRPPPTPIQVGRRRPRRWPLVIAALLLLGGGIAAAILTTSGGGGGARSTHAAPRTTSPPPPSPSPPPSPPPSPSPSPPPPSPTPTPPPVTPPSGTSGEALNLQGFDLMKAGRYSEALPLLQQAVAKLAGTYTPSHRDEAYAQYNLGYTLLGLGQCGEALTHLNQSEHLQGPRSEITAARAQAEACLGGGQGRGHGKGPGKAKGKESD